MITAVYAKRQRIRRRREHLYNFLFRSPIIPRNESDAGKKFLIANGFQKPRILEETVPALQQGIINDEASLWTIVMPEATSQGATKENHQWYESRKPGKQPRFAGNLLVRISQLAASREEYAGIAMVDAHEERLSSHSHEHCKPFLLRAFHKTRVFRWIYCGKREPRKRATPPGVII